MLRLLISLLLAATYAAAAITVVQSKSCDSAGATVTTQTCSFNVLPSVNNAIIVSIAWYNFNGAITATVTDNQGNTYSQAATPVANAAKNEATVYAAVAAASSGAFTVSDHLSAATYTVVHIYEVSGLQTTGIPDQATAGFSDASASSASAITSPTTGAVDFVIGAAAFNSGSTTGNAAGGGYTLGLVSGNTNLTVVGLIDVYRTNATSGAQSPTVTFGFTQAAGYSMMGAAYKGIGTTSKVKHEVTHF
jgi:hypothetical protein